MKQPTDWISEREAYMREALREAAIAFDADEVPVGAVIVRDGCIVARAHNRTEALCRPTAHAELLCIEEALQILNGRLDGCTLYVTLEPCAMCTGAIVNSRLGRLVFGAFDPRAGCCGSVFDGTDGSLGYAVETWGGILESECASILSDFFQNKR